jgi:hypothetical protein
LYDSEIVTPTYAVGENVACAYSWRKNEAKGPGKFLQDSQSRLAKVLRAGNFGGGQTGEMCLGGRVSCAESALLLWFRPAHRATDGQYLPQREVFGLHTNIIQYRPR